MCMWQPTLLLLALSAPNLWGQGPLSKKITDPTLGLKCQELIEKRRQKLDSKSRAQALLRRSQTLRETTPQVKQSIRQKLDINRKKLERILHDISSREKKMAEDIVFKGCPGMAL